MIFLYRESTIRPFVTTIQKYLVNNLESLNCVNNTISCSFQIDLLILDTNVPQNIQLILQHIQQVDFLHFSHLLV